MASLALACGGRMGAGPERPGAAPPRVLPLARTFVLETAGPPPPDTSVSFRTGERRSILLLHGPPENVVFAELVFPPEAFGGDSGRDVRVELHPRPGIYGLDVRISLPVRGGASLTFRYPRYFSAPARARQVYGGDVAFERALAIGRLQPNGEIAFLPSTRPAADNLQAPLPGAGSYLVAAPQ